ncbi:MAG: hypothetical protein R3F60_13120 [bacterium]
MRPLSLALALAALPAHAFERPALDDFYERTRGRAAAFQDCTGYCDGRWLLQLLVGAQVANPSTDALRPALAEGLRLGIDGGFMPNGQSVLRSQAYADLLVVPATGDRFTDFVWKNTAFYSTTDDRSGDGGVHLSADAVVADRTELTPGDFADFQRRPFRLVDAEVEVAPIGPKVDKDAHVALPLGAAWRQRWARGGDTQEERLTLSGALAFRGFPKHRGDHYQLDAARLTHVAWDTPAGEASAWRLSFGYQRLSPDLPGTELWILGGYGWHEGADDAQGWLGQVGVAFHPVPAHQAGLGHDAWFGLDQATARFQRLHRTQLYYRFDDGTWRAGLAWDRVSRGGDVLHTLVPEAGWRPAWLFGLMIGGRVRVAAFDGTGPAPEEERFELGLDWLL